MTVLRAIVLVACGAGLFVGCEAIDDFSQFHVGGGDGGGTGSDLTAPASPDFAARPDGTAAMGDASTVGDAAALDLLALDLAAPDLFMPDLAVPDLSMPDLAPCGVCSPGAQRMIPCGNCGMETDFCTQACQWQAGACVGSGPCSPGATQPGACDACSQQTCGNDCQWSACALKPGNTCHPNTTQGCNHACNSGSYNCGFGPYQDCNGCHWDAQCYCTGCKNNVGQVQQYCYCN